MQSSRISPFSRISLEIRHSHTGEILNRKMQSKPPRRSDFINQLCWIVVVRLNCHCSSGRYWTVTQVKKSTLRVFLEKGGYDIVENYDPPTWLDPRTGRTRHGINIELSRLTGLSKHPLISIENPFLHVQTLRIIFRLSQKLYR